MYLSNKQKMSLGALAAAVMAATGPAHAGLPTAEQLNQMSPPQRMEAIKALAAHEAATRSVKTGRLDSTPPAVVAFSAGTQVDVSKSAEQLRLNVTVADDLSGVTYIWVVAIGPSGQRVFAHSGGHAGMPQVKASFALNLSPFSEPGQWHIEEVGVMDVAFHSTHLNQDELQLMGNTKFEVLSASADLVAPTLSSGKILTPEVSLSRPAKGTASEPPFIRVLLNSSDTGTDAVSGAAYSSAQFCLRDQSDCVYLSSYEQHSLYGMKKFADVLATQPLGPVTLGEYLLSSVTLSDWAGNERKYTSTEFGGETDFSKLFPSTVLTIKP